MAKIWSINSTYGMNNKEINTKFKLEEGQIIKGKIINFNKENNSAVLRLINGRDVSVLVQGNIKDISKEIVNYKVINMSKDEIKIKQVTEVVEPSLNSYEISLGDNEEKLISMLKHDIPITKENVDFVDSLIKLSNSIGNKGDLDNILKNILNSKGIDENSPKGIKIMEELKAFALEFKNLNMEDLLSLMENGIDLNKDNIKSYNKLFKEPYTIMKNTEAFSEYIGILKDGSNLSKVDKIVINKDIPLNIDISNQLKEKINFISEKAKYIQNETANMGKEEMKNISNIFGNRINDFKVYNSISDSYYFVDIPLKYGENEYSFKLIIKDDRKKGKIIDKDNVNIGASINTKNIGTVDIYLRLKDGIIDADIKGEKKYIPLVKAGASILIKRFELNKFNVNLSFTQRKEELNLSSYNDYFNNQEVHSINVLA